MLLALLLLQQPIPPPPNVEALWEVVAQCTEAPVQPGGDLSDVKWYVDSLRTKDSHHMTVAEWLPPDTIVLDVGTTEPWTIAHELVHHRLRGPPGRDKHPFRPFAFPCKLMPYQNP